MNTQEMLSELKELRSILDFEKVLLEAYINDESISLEERWNTWCSAPGCIKNHKRYYLSFENIPDDVIHEYCTDRYRTIELADLVEHLEGADLAKEYVDSAKAWILKGNMGSFEYDW